MLGTCLSLNAALMRYGKLTILFLRVPYGLNLEFFELWFLVLISYEWRTQPGAPLQYWFHKVHYWLHKVDIPLQVHKVWINSRGILRMCLLLYSNSCCVIHFQEGRQIVVVLLIYLVTFQKEKSIPASYVSSDKLFSRVSFSLLNFGVKWSRIVLSSRETWCFAFFLNQFFGCH